MNSNLKKCGIRLIPVLGGTFKMGAVPKKYWGNRWYSDRSEPGIAESCFTPERKVKVPSYLMSETPITVAQYRYAVQAGVCARPEICYTDEPGQYDDWPVVGIRIPDMEAFAAFVGCTLPSEAQWEYAVGGTDAHKYPWGESLPDPWKNFIDDEVEREAVVPFVGEGPKPTQWYETQLGPVGRFPEGDTADGLKDFGGLLNESVADKWSCCYCSGNRYAPSNGDPYLNPSEDDHVVRIGCSSRSRQSPTRACFTECFRVVMPYHPPKIEIKTLRAKRAKHQARDQERQNRMEAYKTAVTQVWERIKEVVTTPESARVRQLGIQFIKLEGGSFDAGFRKQDNADTYDLEAMPCEMHRFDIAQYPITAAQIRQAIDADLLPHREDLETLREVYRDAKSWNTRPCECDLPTAQALAQIFGCRLPRFEEWLYAARGREGRIYPWGNDAPTDRHATFGFDPENANLRNCVENFFYGATPEGVFDMAGNSSEFAYIDHGDPKAADGRKWVGCGGYIVSNADQIKNGVYRFEDHPIFSVRLVRDWQDWSVNPDILTRADDPSASEPPQSPSDKASSAQNSNAAEDAQDLITRWLNTFKAQR